MLKPSEAEVTYDRSQSCPTFDDLFEQYADAVQRYMYARVGDVALAEDLAGVTFLHVAAHLGTFDARRGTPATWLFAVARNVVRDHLRHTGRRPRLVPLSEQLEDRRPGPEEVSMAGERQAALRRAFAGLTEDQRDALALRYLAELSFAEVAAALGRSEAAAKMLVQRGLGALRRRLEAEGNGTRV